MITGTLKVDSQVLKNTADAFKQQSDSIRTLTTQMIDEVTAMNGRFYTLRIAPYRTTEHNIRGLVITIIDSLGAGHGAQQSAQGGQTPSPPRTGARPSLISSQKGG